MGWLEVWARKWRRAECAITRPKRGDKTWKDFATGRLEVFLGLWAGHSGWRVWGAKTCKDLERLSEWAQRPGKTWRATKDLAKDLGG